MRLSSWILWHHLLLCVAWTPLVSSLMVEPKFLLVDEDWPLETPLNVRICSKRRISGVRIASGNLNGRFEIVPSDEFCGRLKLRESLDADGALEQGARGKSFKLVFEERSTKRRANLDIQVADVNDNAPVFTNLPAEINITESTHLLAGNRLYTVETVDADNGIGGVVRFSLRGSSPFRITPGRCSESKCRADVTLVHGLEKEGPAKFLLEVVAKDGAGVSKRVNEANALLSIYILRTNQSSTTPHSPAPTTTHPTVRSRTLKFVAPLLRHESLRVTANTQLSSRIVMVKAKPNVEVELGPKEAGHIIYGIEPSHHFEIDPHSGWVSLKESLVDVAGSTLPLTVQARLLSENGEPLSDEASMLMQVQVIGEEESSSHPICASRHYTGTLNKHSAKIALSEAIKVYDGNQATDEEFSITLEGEHSELFELTPKAVKISGDVSIHVRDRDSLRLINERKLELEIQLFTRSNEKTRPAHRCLLTLRIFNPLDALLTAHEIHATTISTKTEATSITTQVTFASSTLPTTPLPISHHNVSIRENLDPRPILNLLIDGEAASPSVDIRAEMHSTDCPKCASYFAVDRHGQLLTLRPLDAEDFSHAHLAISLMDLPTNKRKFVDVDVRVLDENDNVPIFSQPVYEVLVDACNDASQLTPPLNEILCTVRAVDADIGENVITYGLSPSAMPHFTIDPQRGSIWMVSSPATADLDASGTYEFEVIARDSGSPLAREGRANVSIHFARCPFLAPNLTRSIVNGDGDGHAARGELSLSIQEEPSVPIYNASLSESSPVGTKLFEVDLPLTESGKFPTALVLEEERGREGLLLLSPNGSIYLNGLLDFEQFQQLNANVTQLGEQSPSISELARLVLSIEDENDNGPVFRLPNNYKILLPDWGPTPRSLRLPQPLAGDADGEGGPFSDIEYSLQNDQQRLFEIDKSSSEIRLTRPFTNALQRDEDEMRLVVKAVDNPGGVGGRRNSAQLTDQASKDVSARRVLDSIPSPLEIYFHEGMYTTDMVIHSLNSTMLLPEDLTLSVERNDTSNAYLTIHENNELRLAGNISELGGRSICAEVKAKWTGDNTSAFPAHRHQSREICLVVKEHHKEAVSRGAPNVTITWPRPNSIHTFKENRNYTRLLHINASSPPHGNSHGDVTFHISNISDTNTQFSVDTNGTLRSLQPFDYERKSRYWLEVEACAGSNLTACATTRSSVGFWVVVEDDERDNCPYFEAEEETKRLHVMENGIVPIGEPPVFVGSFTPALMGDGRSGENRCCYTLLDDYDGTFILADPRRPELAVRRSLDREQIPRYSLTVVADNCAANTSTASTKCRSEMDGHSAETSQRKMIWVEVEDMNDCLPRFARREYLAKVMERVTKVGEPILQLRATDDDIEPQGLHYHISSTIETERGPVPSNEEPFKVNSTTGTIISNIVYSYDMPRSYSFRMAVVDGANHQDECQVMISVINYKQQVEFTFDADQNMLERSLDRIEKLLTEAVGFKGVVDELIFFPNYTTIVSHFIDQRGLALPGIKVKSLFDDNDSDGGERARRELRNHFQHVYSDHNPRLIDSAESELAATNTPTSKLGAMTAFRNLLPSLINGGVPAIVFYSMLFLMLTIVIALLSLGCCRSSGESATARLDNKDYRWGVMSDEPFYSDNTLLHRHGGGCQNISYPTLNRITVLPNNASLSRLGRRLSADRVKHDVYSNPRTSDTARSTEF